MIWWVGKLEKITKEIVLQHHCETSETDFVVRTVVRYMLDHTFLSECIWSATSTALIAMKFAMLYCRRFFKVCQSGT